MARAFAGAAVVLGMLTASSHAQTSTTAIVDVGSAQLETTTWGDGEPIMLLPGSGSSSSAFGLLGPELARRGYRAIAVNPRGIGGSTGPLESITYHDYAADVGRPDQSCRRRTGAPCIGLGVGQSDRPNAGG